MIGLGKVFLLVSNSWFYFLIPHTNSGLGHILLVNPNKQGSSQICKSIQTTHTFPIHNRTGFCQLGFTTPVYTILPSSKKQDSGGPILVAVTYSTTLHDATSFQGKQKASKAYSESHCCPTLKTQMSVFPLTQASPAPAFREAASLQYSDCWLSKNCLQYSNQHLQVPFFGCWLAGMSHKSGLCPTFLFCDPCQCAYTKGMKLFSVTQYPCQANQQLQREDQTKLPERG